MTDNPLKQQLQQLHQQLQQSPALDPDTLGLLEQIAVDIESLGDKDSADLSDRIQQQAVEFEQEHPTLSSILHEIVNVLGRIGV
jgi:hypothetical protein